MIEDVITRSEIQQSRSPREFIAWFENALSRINGRHEFRDQILLHQGIAKEIFEEVFPLYRLLQLREARWSQRRFQNVLGSQQYDVRVTSELAEESFIEISVADRDFAEVQRMRYFTTHKSVSAIGRVSSLGTKRTGYQIEVEQEAQLHSNVVVQKIQKLEQAIEKKCAIEYQPRTSLLVYFDDYVALSDSDDDALVQAMIQKVDRLWRPRFDALFLVGASGRKIWSQNEK